jgi:hypothetical protein
MPIVTWPKSGEYCFSENVIGPVSSLLGPLSLEALEFPSGMTCVMLRLLPSIILKRPVLQEDALRASTRCRFASKFAKSSRVDPIFYFSPIDAEPLHRYRKGGYHPVALGKSLKEGRYKILHK